MGGDSRLGVVFLAEPVISLVWYDNSRFFRVDGREGEVLQSLVLFCKAGILVLTAGFPREHLVIAWKRVDFPTFARPT